MSRWAFVAFLIISFVGNSRAADVDGGGRLGDYLDGKAADHREEIAGVCASACTVKLGAANACVHADARRLFDAARDANGRSDRLATLMMLQEYLRRIRGWAERRRALASLSFTETSGAEAIALGVRSCDALFRR